MNINPFKISENFVFKKLKTINNGKLILENHNGKSHIFGDLNSNLEVKIKIHNPKFYFNIFWWSPSNTCRKLSEYYSFI